MRKSKRQILASEKEKNRHLARIIIIAEVLQRWIVLKRLKKIVLNSCGTIIDGMNTNKHYIIKI